MKRYSISTGYGRTLEGDKVHFNYYGRTDDVQDTICKFKEKLQRWINMFQDESYEYRNHIDDYCAIRITDSQTKQVVFEEIHLPEQYGYKKIKTIVENEYCSYVKGEWIKL